MKPDVRKQFNEAFTEIKYQTYIQFIEKVQGGQLQFRLAETPIFLDKSFTQLLLNAGNAICHQLSQPEFIHKTTDAIPAYAITKNETPLPECLVIDFAIAENEQKEIVPKLIELQGFPSLFGFELLHDNAFHHAFEIPSNYSPFLNQYNREQYIAHLKKMVLGENNKHTILLEIKPEQQKTKIDFYQTQSLLGLPIVCISEIFQKEDRLYYHRAENDIQIERIYNRMVFEEIQQQETPIQQKWEIIRNTEGLEWVTHPHHFFRFSKYSIPFLNGISIPYTQFLHNLKEIPSHLDQYILKPLFSFAGQGVIIDLTKDILSEIKDPQNWILQEKVHYAPVIETPSGPTKAEIRLFYFWDNTLQKYIATMNLVRLSKGKMVGVNYNKTATWVGGSLAYFES
jgi:hypothetical protein